MSSKPLPNAFDQHVMILATGPQGELGNKGGLPWPVLTADMTFFTKVTKGRTRNAVVMGRKTWQSIPAKHRPLPKRLNIVVSRDPDAREKYDIPDSVVLVDAFEKTREHMEGVDMCFVCGGASLYEASFRSKELRAIYHTLVTPLKTAEKIEADTVFDRVVRDAEPACDFGLEVLSEVVEAGFQLQFRLLDFGMCGTNEGERQYMDLVRRILTTGEERADRTSVGTLSVFGPRPMRFDLTNGTMPLLTSKNTNWRSLAIELLWFVSGSTSAKELSSQGVKIWNANGSRSFLDGRGLTDREEGDLGPVYGFQWRHFGTEYVDMHADYTGQGVDQLAQVIETIKTNPTSRRIVMSAWNPADLHLMALPPCHMFAQFYVHDGGELSCQVYIRSNDTGLGASFNIASYALLTHMIAHCCGLKAKELIYTIGDAHIYSNHVEQLKRQLKRTPFTFPKLIVDTETTDIDAITYKDLKLRGYACHPAIAMDMAV